MHEKMKLWVIIANLATLAWFIALQYYRLKDSGQACSGDYQLYGRDNADFKFNHIRNMFQDNSGGNAVDGSKEASP